MDRAHILARNVLYNLISKFWFLILVFVTIPYIVRKLGTDAYGILSIVGVVIGYFGFLELGLGKAVVKYVSEYHARKDYNAIREIIGSALIFYILVGFIGAMVIASLTGLVVTRVLKIPSNLVSVSYVTFYLSALGFLINMPLNVFGSIPRALQRFDIVNKVGICIGSLHIFLKVLLLYMGFFLKEIVILNIFISLLSILVYIVVSKKLLPQISLYPVFSYTIFIKLLRFGGWITVGQIAGTLAVRLDRLLIGIFLPVSLLTYYTVPYNLMSRIWIIPRAVTSAIFPAISELAGLKREDKIKELYFRTTKYIVAGVILPIILLIIFADKLLYFWMGPEFAVKSTRVLQLLGFAFLLSCSGWISATIANASGNPDIFAKVQVGQSVVNIALCILLIPRLGINGAALAWLIRHMVGIPILIRVVSSRLVKVSMSELMSNSFLRPFLVAIATAGLGFLLRSTVDSAITLAASFAFACLFYCILSYYFTLDQKEKKMALLYIHNAQRGLVGISKVSK